MSPDRKWKWYSNLLQLESPRQWSMINFLSWQEKKFYSVRDLQALFYFWLCENCYNSDNLKCCFLFIDLSLDASLVKSVVTSMGSGCISVVPTDLQHSCFLHLMVVGLYTCGIWSEYRPHKSQNRGSRLPSLTSHHPRCLESIRSIWSASDSLSWNTLFCTIPSGTCQVDTASSHLLWNSHWCLCMVHLDLGGSQVYSKHPRRCPPRNFYQRWKTRAEDILDSHTMPTNNGVASQSTTEPDNNCCSPESMAGLQSNI